MSQNSPSTPAVDGSTAPSCKVCSEALQLSSTLGRKDGFDFLRCGACQSVTVHPFPTVEELIAFYQGYQGSGDYTRKAPKKIARAKRRIQRLVKLTEGRKFLDIGSNYGFTTKAAQELGLDAHGIDIDGVAVQASKKAYGDMYSHCSVEKYADNGAKADIVFTSEVIEHVPEPEAFIRAIGKILNKGGILYLTTPSSDHWRIPSDFTKYQSARPPEHITFFSRKGMSLLLAKYGMEVLGFKFSLTPGMRLTARKV